MDLKKETLKGVVQQVVYQNSSNGYTVLNLSSNECEFVSVGTMSFVSVGETIEVTGNFVTNPKFGEQFLISSYTKIQPTTTDDILTYLSAGAVKGIGAITAKRMVDCFGEDTLEVLKNRPDKLCKIKGITINKANKLSEQYKSVFGMREIIDSLNKIGLAPNEAIKVYNQWGEEAFETIKFDPYCICGEPLSLSFDKADAIASNMQHGNNDLCRIRAGITYILRYNQNNGHVCLPLEKLSCVTADFLGLEKDEVREILIDMISSDILVKSQVDGKDFVFTHDMYDAEQSIASRISMMVRFPAKSIVGIENEINEIETKKGIQYATSQRKAISEALKKGLLILTGGPGTGKTTTLNAIITILSNSGEKVLLAAPTGRAAKRMSELTSREAKTIHRLLEVAWDKEDNPIFNKNEKNLLECDAIIIDEVSMIDTALFNSLLKALPLGCRLILVGDTNQLPCVGAGNVLHDLIKCELLPVVTLDEIFRQSKSSLIVTNAHKIVKGEMPEIDIRDNDFFMIREYDPQRISDTIVSLCSKRLPSAYKISPFDIQVLAPSKKGTVGTNSLNVCLQEAINPPTELKRQININGKIIRKGDKVMQIKNNYDISYQKDNGEISSGIFNGDTGTLIDISEDRNSVSVRFDDKIAVYSIEQAAQLDLAYAMTVHKSQGSEFCAVVIPMYKGPHMLYYRNLLYTAVTRAKKILILVGMETIVEQMVNNNKKNRRYSGLVQTLIDELT